MLGWLAKWHLVEIILGIFLAGRNMACLDGEKWVYEKFVGKFFFFFHLIGALVATGCIRAIFVKTPFPSEKFWLSDSDLQL